MTSIKKFLSNKKNVKLIAKEISDILKDKITKEQIDYSFSIDSQYGTIKSKDPNTSISFDTDDNQTLNNLKKLLFSEELSDIEEGSKEEKDLMIDVRSFLKEVSTILNEKYYEVIENLLRKEVLNNAKKEIIPLNAIEIISIDIADYSSIPEPAKYLMQIGKVKESAIDVDKVTEYVHNKQVETEKTVEEIFDEEKNINPLFDNITGLKTGTKYLYDVVITLFVDYSSSTVLPEEIDN